MFLQTNPIITWPVGIVLWVQILIYFLPQSMQYHVIWDRVIMAPDCSLIHITNGLTHRSYAHRCVAHLGDTSLGTHNRPPGGRHLRGISGYTGLWGFYKIWSNRPSTRPDPTGWNCPLYSYGDERIPRALTLPFFSECCRCVFPVRWSRQHNESGWHIYAPLNWITADSGNGSVSARRQAIAWTNFHL